MDLGEKGFGGGGVLTGLVWLRIGTSAKRGNKPSGSIKRWEALE
jgi:hypothetical protein